MNVIEWLMTGDLSHQRLSSKYLLERPMPYAEDGYIKRYLDLFDVSTGLWGGGVYGPKWISTHYTMLELKTMEISPENAYYHIGLGHLLDHEWRTLEMTQHHPGQDICVLGMVVGLGAYGLGAYGLAEDVRLNEIIDYIIAHQMPDGGWNCAWNSQRRPSKKSSLHTTLTVLEAFQLVLLSGYTHQKETIESMIVQGEEFILKKNLFRSVSTGEIINPDFVKFHYPARWKYDAFRALEYFSSAKRPYDTRMQEALDLVIKGMAKGYINKGSQYSGKLHFKLETTKAGRFNTLMALKILKAYAPATYEAVIAKTFEFK